MYTAIACVRHSFDLAFPGWFVEYGRMLRDQRCTLVRWRYRWHATFACGRQRYLVHRKDAAPVGVPSR